MELKLKHREKNGSTIWKNWAVVSIAVLVIGALIPNFACSFSTGAAQTAASVASPTPQIATAIATETPSATPNPTPTPIPTPENIPELSLEEERALLGVEAKDLERVRLPVNIFVILYSQKNETGEDVTRIAWTVVGSYTQDTADICNVWGGEKMFTISRDVPKFKEALKKSVPANTRLESSKIVDSTGVYALEEFYKKHGIVFELPVEYKKITSLSHSSIMEYSLSMSDLMDLYIKCTPKVYRTSWKDFDETLVPETTAP